MDFSKDEIAALTNQEHAHRLARRRHHRLGRLHRPLGRRRADARDGASRWPPNPIVFALANPVPEITPDLAREAGALAVATGRSDYPNQVNNSLAFPGVFRGALDVKARGSQRRDEDRRRPRHRRAGRRRRALGRFHHSRQSRSPRPAPRRRRRRPGRDRDRRGPRSWSTRARSRSAAATSSTKAPTSSLPVSSAWECEILIPPERTSPVVLP